MPQLDNGIVKCKIKSFYLVATSIFLPFHLGLEWPFISLLLTFIQSQLIHSYTFLSKYFLKSFHISIPFTERWGKRGILAKNTKMLLLSSKVFVLLAACIKKEEGVWQEEKMKGYKPISVLPKIFSYHFWSFDPSILQCKHA